LVCLGPGGTDGLQKCGGEKVLPISSRCELGNVFDAFGECDRDCVRAKRVDELHGCFQTGLVLIQDQIDAAECAELVEDVRARVCADECYSWEAPGAERQQIEDAFDGKHRGGSACLLPTEEWFGATQRQVLWRWLRGLFICLSDLDPFEDAPDKPDWVAIAELGHDDSACQELPAGVIEQTDP
jgi:hypothetical protein